MLRLSKKHKELFDIISNLRITIFISYILLLIMFIIVILKYIVIRTSNHYYNVYYLYRFDPHNFYLILKDELFDNIYIPIIGSILFIALFLYSYKSPFRFKASFWVVID